jgi:hypothetical protein
MWIFVSRLNFVASCESATLRILHESSPGWHNRVQK